jgi:dipeptidyl aminopeptidase/acylaminoacyl peptidase
LIVLGASLMAAAPARDHDITGEDYFSQVWLASSAVSPDGRHAVYTEKRWDKVADKRLTELWVTDTRSGAATRVTFDGASKWGVQWSPDGQSLYFAGSQKKSDVKGAPYDGKPQVWRMSFAGGAPVPMTRVKDGVGAFKLSADGGALYYTTSTEAVTAPWKGLKSTHSKVNYGHGVHDFDQLWTLDMTTWRSRKIADSGRVISQFAVSPDERRIAAITKPDETLLTGEGWSQVDVWDLKTGAVTTVTPEGWRTGHPSPYGWLGDLAWSRDGDALATSVDFDGFPSELLLVEWRDDAPALRQLKRPSRIHVWGGLSWRGDSRELVFIGEERARRHVYSIKGLNKGEQGALKQLTKGDVVVDHYSMDRKGRTLVAAIGTPTEATDLRVVSRSGAMKKITNANPQVATWKLPQLSVVSWKGEDGATVEGVLELPPGYKAADGPLPMIVQIHGGPTSATPYRFQYWIYGRGIFSAKGYAVFSPNYRGSTGYGDTFMTQLVGRENDIEVSDILKGVDAMVARGIADPGRLGVTGWSNGGYLTNCLITKTTRFKAASSGAGVIHQVMQWAIEDTPGHVINYMEGLPWDKPKAYRHGSPLWDLSKVTTPTVIHMGERDPRVPLAHAQALYRGLHVYLGVDAELLVYPGAGHGLTTYSHRKAKLLWDIAWFDHYLGVKVSEDGPAPPKE